MELQNIIFHALNTQQHSSEVLIHERSEELPLPNEKATRLVQEAKKSYSKDSSIAYARFDHGWFPDKLTELIRAEITFIQFSSCGLNNLQKQLEEEPLTTGGHLFFIKYSEGNEPFILALLLKDIEGFVVNKMELSESHILNLDKLHFGARVNIKNWIADNGNYITFLKGSNRVNVTSYFKKFLCIDDSSFNEPRDNTRKLTSAVKDYCNEFHSDNETRKFQIRERVANELYTKNENNEAVTLAAVSALISPENTNHFVEYINEMQYEIQPDFKVDKTSIRQLTRYQGKTKNISISFEHDAIEKGLINLKTVQQNGQEKPILEILDIPDNLIKELKPE